MLYRERVNGMYILGCAVLALALGLPVVPKSRARVVEEVQRAETIFQGIGIDDSAPDGDRLDGGGGR